MKHNLLISLAVASLALATVTSAETTAPAPVASAEKSLHQLYFVVDLSGDKTIPLNLLQELLGEMPAELNLQLGFIGYRDTPTQGSHQYEGYKFHGRALTNLLEMLEKSEGKDDTGNYAIPLNMLP